MQTSCIVTLDANQPTSLQLSLFVQQKLLIFVKGAFREMYIYRYTFWFLLNIWDTEIVCYNENTYQRPTENMSLKYQWTTQVVGREKIRVFLPKWTSDRIFQIWQMKVKIKFLKIKETLKQQGTLILRFLHFPFSASEPLRSKSTT